MCIFDLLSCSRPQAVSSCFSIVGPQKRLFSLWCRGHDASDHSARDGVDTRANIMAPMHQMVMCLIFQCYA